MNTATAIRLENGQAFPNIKLSVVGQNDLSLPKDLAGRWVVVLFYRSLNLKD